MTCRRGAIGGFTLTELLLTIAVAATLTGIAVPLTTGTVEAVRAAGAARHLAARIAMMRVDAVRRSTTLGLRFEAEGADYFFTAHADTNGNGIRSIDIARGIDATLTSPERLRNDYPGVAFGLLPGIPDLDGAQGNSDGVRIGVARILSLTPTGSATSGTLYVHGRRNQYAVRVFGATGRVRVFEYDTGANRWNSR